MRIAGAAKPSAWPIRGLRDQDPRVDQASVVRDMLGLPQAVTA